MKIEAIKDQNKYTLTKKNSAAKIKKQNNIAEDDEVAEALAEPSLKKRFEAKLKEHNEYLRDSNRDRDEEDGEDYTTPEAQEKAIEDMDARLYFWENGKDRPRGKKRSPLMDGSGKGKGKGAMILSMSDDEFEKMDKGEKEV